MNRMASMVMVGLLGLTACGDDEENYKDFKTFCDAYIAEDLKQADQCGSVAKELMKVYYAETDFCRENIKAVNDGLYTYDASKASSCLAWMAHSCDKVDDRTKSATSPCEKILMGVIPAGQPCNTGHGCVEGTTCELIETENSCRSECKLKVYFASNEDCEYTDVENMENYETWAGKDKECPADTECRPNASGQPRCQAEKVAGVGQSCADADCNDVLYCDNDTEVCKVLKTSGACLYHAECVDACINHQCVAIVKKGQACMVETLEEGSLYTNCESGTMCKNGTCQLAGFVGYECLEYGNWMGCQIGYCDKTNKTCKSSPRIGEACDDIAKFCRDDAECVNKVCVASNSCQ